MKHVCAFRHALALDERRVKFLPEYANGDVGPSSEGSIREVWFAGSHSDMYVLRIDYLLLDPADLGLVAAVILKT